MHIITANFLEIWYNFEAVYSHPYLEMLIVIRAGDHYSMKPIEPRHLRKREMRSMPFAPWLHLDILFIKIINRIDKVRLIDGITIRALTTIFSGLNSPQQKLFFFFTFLYIWWFKLCWVEYFCQGKANFIYNVEKHEHWLGLFKCVLEWCVRRLPWGCCPL